MPAKNMLDQVTPQPSHRGPLLVTLFLWTWSGMFVGTWSGTFSRVTCPIKTKLKASHQYLVWHSVARPTCPFGASEGAVAPRARTPGTAKNMPDQVSGGWGGRPRARTPGAATNMPDQVPKMARKAAKKMLDQVAFLCLF